MQFWWNFQKLRISRIRTLWYPWILFISLLVPNIDINVSTVFDGLSSANILKMNVTSLPYGPKYDIFDSKYQNNITWKQIYQKMVQIMILRYVSSGFIFLTTFSVIILNFKSLLITETYKLQGETIISLVANGIMYIIFWAVLFYFQIPFFFSKASSWYKLNHGYRYNIKLLVRKLQ